MSYRKAPIRLAGKPDSAAGGSWGFGRSLPGPLYTLTDWLPTHGAVLALRAMATGRPDLVLGLVELAAWLAIGTLATIIVTDRRRYLSPRRLRLDAPPDRRTADNTVGVVPR